MCPVVNMQFTCLKRSGVKQISKKFNFIKLAMTVNKLMF